MTQKVHSSEEPNWYFLDKILFKLDDGKPYLTLRLHWNIEEVLVPEPEPHTEWQYDEQTIEHAPIDTLTEEEVVSYIEAHQTELLEEAQNEQAAKTVVDANIETVRTKPVIPTWKEKLFEEQELYAGTVVEIDATKLNKRYIKIKHLSQDIYVWCYVTGSVLRDHQEGKVGIGDYVVVCFVNGRDYPIVLNRVIA